MNEKYSITLSDNRAVNLRYGMKATKRFEALYGGYIPWLEETIGASAVRALIGEVTQGEQADQSEVLISELEKGTVSPRKTPVYEALACGLLDIHEVTHADPANPGAGVRVVVLGEDEDLLDGLLDPARIGEYTMIVTEALAAALGFTADPEAADPTIAPQGTPQPRVANPARVVQPETSAGSSGATSLTPSSDSAQPIGIPG
jgi:hypothetical protein